ncbi:hypothetical protein BJ912DRAFT_862301, partial [Pholiota molesta]
KASLLDFSIRRAIRDIPDFLPEAGYSSRKLALLVHENNLENLQCRYHEKTKNRDKYDGIDSAGQKIHGVPYKPQLNASTQTNITPQDDFMHCGCYIDDVLLDFFLWKTMTIHSHNPELRGIYESMMATEFPPRVRAFVLQLFLVFSNLQLDDLYALDYGTPAYYTRRHQVQGRKLLGLMDQHNVPDPVRKLIALILADPSKGIVAPTADDMSTDSESEDDNN